MSGIKFRAFSLKDNIYGKPFILSRDFICDRLNDVRFPQDDVIFEQFIGLKDKSDTEIYESDICSFSSKKGKYMGVVEWSDSLAGFGLRMIDNNFLYTFSELNTMGIDLDTLEVIGNVHQNHELLTANTPENFVGTKKDIKTERKNTMLDYAIQQITGFNQALSTPDAGYLASSMGLTRGEWKTIKSTESWINQQIVDDIDKYFEGGE